LGERVHKSHIGYPPLFIFCIGLINADGIYSYVPILGAKPNSAVRARLVERAVIVSVDFQRLGLIGTSHSGATTRMLYAALLLAVRFNLEKELFLQLQRIG
jgi:hypothetical protein